MDPKTLMVLQDRIAELAIGPSTLRNQGAKNVVGRARSFLKRIELKDFGKASRTAFYTRLDQDTLLLKRYFPPGARNWGAARKAINIFLRDVLYNSYLSSVYHFVRLEKWLEVPLESRHC